MKHYAASTDTSAGKSSAALSPAFCLSVFLLCGFANGAAFCAPFPNSPGPPSAESAKSHLADPSRRSSSRSYIRAVPPSEEPKSKPGSNKQLSPLDRLLRDAEVAVQAQEFQRAMKIFDHASGLFPDDPGPMLGQAKVFYCLNDLEGCQKTLLQCARRFPSYAPAFAASGKLEHSRGDLVAAKKSYRKAIQLNPRDGDSYFRLAQIALTEGNVNEAIVNALNCLRCDPHHPSAHLLLGEIYSRSGASTEAIDHLKEVLKPSPENPQVLLLTARLQRSVGSVNAALENLRRARELSPEESMILEEFCLLYGAKNDWVNAREYAEEWTKLEPDNSLAWFVRGWSCRNSQELHDAASFLNRAVTLAPENAHLHNAYGMVLLDERKPDDASREFEKASQLAPKDIAPRLNAINALISGGRWSGAADAARAALVDFPDSPEAQSLLAYIYARDGADNDARAFALQSVKQRPDSGTALIALALLELKQGHGDLASEYFQKAVDANPTSPFALIELSKDLKRRGRARESVELLQRVLQMAPSNLQAKAAMGQALIDAGNFQGAILHLKECVVRNPKDLELRLSLADAQVQSGDLETAAETLEKAVVAAPASPKPLAILARLALDRGDYKKADALAHDALKFDRQNFIALTVLATVQFQRQSLQDCLETCQSLLSLQPGNAEPLLLSARCAFRQNRWTESIALFEQIRSTGRELCWQDTKDLIECFEQTGQFAKATDLLSTRRADQLKAGEQRELQKLKSKFSRRIDRDISADDSANAAR